MNITDIRTGIGYDVHRIAADRKLVLCGFEVPCEFGLDGHSDADVMTHALMDSMLGAAGLFDIGYYFPVTDDNFKNISSLKLLSRVKKLIHDNGFKIMNTDMVLISERPKIISYVTQMKHNIAEVLEIESSRVGVKATTNERMGFLGRGDGMAAFATTLLYK